MSVVEATQEHVLTVRNMQHTHSSITVTIALITSLLRVCMINLCIFLEYRGHSVGARPQGYRAAALRRRARPV